MNRQEIEAMSQRVIAKAVKETDHAALKVDDLVFCLSSTKCFKIIALDDHFATVSDKEKQYLVPVTDLASNEAVRVNTYLAIYGDRCVMVSMPGVAPAPEKEME